MVAGDRVVPTVGPEARNTRKSPENRRDGHRVCVAACPETGIITGEGLTRAAGEENSDAALAGSRCRPAPKSLAAEAACISLPEPAGTSSTWTISRHDRTEAGRQTLLS